MTDIKIPELPLTDTINLEDLIVLEQASGTKKASIGTVLSLSDEQKIYGAQRSLTSQTWTRTDDAVGLTANATFDGSVVTNDFDSLYPWNSIITQNISNDGTINAQYGDLNFKFDGSNGNVMTYFPKMYISRYMDSSYEYLKVSNKSFINSIEIEPFYVGRYCTEIDTASNPMSRSGAYNDGVKNIGSFRTQARTKGSGWGLLDWRLFVIQILYQIEYADNNSQSKVGNGVMSLTNNSAYKAYIAESSVNRIILANSYANNFTVGQSIHLTTNGWNWDVAKYRVITSIEDYNSSYKSIYFDGDPVNITTSVYLIHSAVKSGECDSLGMKSGCLTNDGKHSVIYRGVENLWGNQWQFIDSINIKDWQAWVCYDNAEYISNKFTSPYVQLGYINANANGNPSKMGFDSVNPLIGLTETIGTSYYGDYYYQNSGNRILAVGGYWPFGSYAGLFSFYCSNTSSGTFYYFGSRLCKTA